MKISIITVNYNNKKGLERTLQSVVGQTFTDYEHIVIDAGSTEGSKEIIEQNAQLFSYWVSEKDAGVYNGMNKGIAKAKGEYCFFLNSGDWLVNEHVLANIDNYLSSDFDIIYGNLIKINPATRKETECKYPEKLTFNHFYIHTLPHQGSFIKTSLFSEIGMYDEEYRITADWAFFILAICKFNKSYKYVDIAISYFILDGIGSIESNWENVKSERKHFLEKHFNIFTVDYKAYNDIKNLQVLRYWNIFKKTFLYVILKKLSKSTSSN